MTILQRLIWLGLMSAALGGPALAQDAAEIAFWESVRDSKTVAEFQAYLSAYPKGTFAPLARLRITALGGQAPAPAASPATASVPTPPTPPSPAVAVVPRPPAPPPSATAAAPPAVPPTTAPDPQSAKLTGTSDEKPRAAPPVPAPVQQATPAAPPQVAPSQAAPPQAAPQQAAQAPKRPASLAEQERVALDLWAKGDAPGAIAAYRPVAEQGGPEKQYTFGIMHFRAQGAAHNEAEGVVWLRRAADAGFAGAQRDLGAAYEAGSGVAKNEVEALKWFRLAAAQDNPEAENDIGRFYTAGRAGLKANLREGVTWFTRSVHHGSMVAAANLADHYLSGLGVTAADPVSAYGWAKVAVLNSPAGSIAHNAADPVVAAAKAKLAAAQITKLDAWATAYKPGGAGNPSDAFATAAPSAPTSSATLIRPTTPQAVRGLTVEALRFPEEKPEVLAQPPAPVVRTAQDSAKLASRHRRRRSIGRSTAGARRAFDVRRKRRRTLSTRRDTRSRPCLRRRPRTWCSPESTRPLPAPSC